MPREYKSDVKPRAELISDSIDPLVELTDSDFLPPGTVLAGRYEILSVLGSGGNGIVYRVRQTFLNQELALKTISRHRMSETAIARFENEAKTAFAVKHPNVVAVHDYGVLEDGTPFLAMELLEGITLSQRLRTEGAMSTARAIPIFAQICLGLAYAHDCGVVHRDVKPSNIILDERVPEGIEGSVRIVDFGIAKATQHEGGELQALTRTGEIFGSPLYMSPEQCAGQRVDKRSDIYSLGCVFFEALTGVPPFVGDTALSTMIKHLTEKPPTLKEASLGGDFPEQLETLIAAMLEKSPDARYKNLGVVALDLSAIASGAKGRAKTPPKSPARAGRKLQVGFPAFTSLAAMLFVGVFIGMVYGFYLGSSVVRPSTALPDSRQRAQADDYARTAQENRAMRNMMDEPLSENINPDQLCERGNALMFKQEYRDLPPRLLQNVGEDARITQVNIVGCVYRPESLKFLCGNTTYLNASSSSFHDGAALALTASKKLNTLEINSVPLYDKGFEYLSSIKSLENLSLEGTPITDSGLANLSKHGRFDSLNLRNCEKITNRGMTAFQNMTIRELNLSGTPFNNSGLSSVAKIKGLKTLSMCRTGVTLSGLEQLCESSPDLKRIDIAACPLISIEDVYHLRDKFPKLQILESEPESAEEAPPLGPWMGP